MEPKFHYYVLFSSQKDLAQRMWAYLFMILKYIRF